MPADGFMVFKDGLSIPFLVVVRDLAEVQIVQNELFLLWGQWYRFRFDLGSHCIQIVGRNFPQF